MRIRCIKLPTQDSGSLELNKTYVVHALTVIEDTHYVDILTIEGYFLPYEFPMSFFEVTEPRLSRFFEIGQRLTNYGLKVFISYPEWVRDKDFYYKLVDGPPEARNVVEKYERLMNLEFKHAEVDKTATRIDVAKNWVMCAECGESWSDQLHMELTQCPKCGLIQAMPE